LIVDQFGNPVREFKRAEKRTIASVSVRDRYSDYPSEGLTPQRLAVIFKEADHGEVSRQAELFEEMEEKDTHLSAELLKRKNAVNSLDFDVIPYEEGAKTSALRRKKNIQNDRVCDFCRDVIFSLPEFEEGLFDLLDAIGKGFSMSELIWDVSAGQAWVTQMRWIHQKKVTFVNTMTPRIITDEHLMGEAIPAFKTIYHRLRARSGHDTRAGMLRVCAWMYLFKNYSIKDWVAFSEVCGMPIRLGKYDPSASTEDRDALVTAIQNIGSDAAGIISKATEIEFVESLGKTQTNNLYKEMADFCNTEISKAVIGATLTTDVGDTGSYAAGKVHNEVRMDLVKSDCFSLANTLRLQLLRPLVGYNFGWSEPVPWFQFYLNEPEDLKTLSEVYRNLNQMGQPIAAEHVAERFGVPLPEAGQTVLPPAGVAPQVAKRVVAKNEPADQSPAATLDALGEKTLAEAKMQDMVAPIKALLNEATSLEDFRDKLLGAYDHMDGSKLADLMQQAFTLAELSGRFDAGQNA
jgi:phage gp29-like protein